MFGTEKIPGIENRIAELRREVENITGRLRGLVQHGHANAAQFDTYFAAHLAATSAKADNLLEKLPPHRFLGWDAPQWDQWQPPIWDPNSTESEPTSPPNIRIGQLVESRRNGALQFSVPAMVPFIGQNKTIIIRTHGTLYEAGLGLLQSLLIRTALMLPHQTAYTLLDPAGNGAAFPMRRHLPQVRENSGDVRRDLDGVVQAIQRINESYLDASTPSFELVDPQVRINERYQFVFAADFPNKYDRRAIEALQSVATTGPRTGTYVFIHHNADIELPRDISTDEFKNAITIDLTQRHSFTASSLVFQPDPAPDAKFQERAVEKLRNAKPPERRVDWRLIVPAETEWWQGNASEIITTPIGVSGATGTLNVWFGMNAEGYPCAHGMLGAMTGSGKSNLYHVLILGLCTRYSPNELRLFLIDGKDGVEFQAYRDLPHAEVVSLKSSPQLSRSVLAELVAERERRNAIFVSVGVTDLTGYHRAGQPKGKLPRILLLVDEYQELFEGDKDGEASSLLLQLAQQGRSAGIHMLLGSQRFGAAGMLNQTAIFGNVHLRMAMQMTNSDVQALNEFGRRGKQLIMTCDLPGKIVVNDRSGDDAGNAAGKVAYLSGEQRKVLIQTLIERAETTLAPKEAPTTIVFDGKAQPNLIKNPYVSFLTHQPRWLTPQEFETMARRPVHDEGLDIIDWFAAEHPTVAWLGQDFRVRGEAMVIFRRRAAENLLIVGGANAARYGMLAAIMAGLVLNGNTTQAEFVIWDRSIPGTAWHETLQKVNDLVLRPAGYQVAFYRESKDAEAVLDRILAEMEWRHRLEEAELIHETSLFAVMTDLERVDELRRRADTYGMSETPLGQKLNRICVEGPALGVHLILSFSGVRPMSHVVDERRGLLNFRHRVALQMSEDESLTFVRSRKAAQLQTEGPAPVCALYMDVENDRALRFKPYSVESTIAFTDQLREIGERIAEWKVPAWMTNISRWRSSGRRS
jgi:S-DNA-T family DNA segregation ATPase FtsK/SpoIIIE